MPEAVPFGFFNIDKPLNLTSHDVVAQVRRAFRIKKVGHAGTLDPLATGVLILCIGAATRLSEYVMHAAKRYRATLRLGVTTDTYDAGGKVQTVRDASCVTREDVVRALSQFVGEIEQIPPMYSAIKQGGRKLYELARVGQTVERQARQVRIDRVDLLDWSPPHFTLDVMCSAGTYIRSLAHDLGEALGVGAHLEGLVRTASGSLTLENAVPLETLLRSPDWTRHLISPEVALADLPAVHLDTGSADHVLHGRSVSVAGKVEDGALGRAYAPDGRFIAILQAQRGRWKPHKVFLSHS